MAYDTSYYENQIKKYNEYADKVAAQNMADAQKTQQSALKQAYVTRLQNQQKLNQNLAQSGIRGGMTETSNLNLANQYGMARQAANANYAASVDSINRSTAENKFNNMMSTESAKRQYIENREAEDRANKREDAAIAREQEQLQYERRQAQYTAKYSKYFSEKELKKALKTAEDPLEIMAINSRLGYVKSVNKGKKWL